MEGGSHTTDRGKRNKDQIHTAEELKAIEEQRMTKELRKKENKPQHILEIDYRRATHKLGTSKRADITIKV